VFDVSLVFLKSEFQATACLSDVRTTASVTCKFISSALVVFCCLLVCFQHCKLLKNVCVFEVYAYVLCV